MTISLRRLRREFRSLISDERGSYLALIAFVLTGVMGFAGMGIDLSMWYQEKRSTQNMADAAAVAATHVSQRGGDLSEMTAAALAEAIRNGYESGPNNQVIVTAAAGGPVGGATPIVDVEVRRAVPLFMLAVFRDDEQIIAAAASGGTRSQGSVCIIGLDYAVPNNNTARNVQISGNQITQIPCGVHSNSLTTDSLYINGNVTMTGTPATAAGGIQIVGSADVEVTSQITMQPFYGYMNDPLASGVFPDRTAISAIACAPGGSQVINSDTTIDPDADGNYKICGSLEVRPGNTLTLNPGIYYVEDGYVLIQGTLDATGGVTIVLTGTTPATVSTIDIRAQASTNLFAPSAPGPYQGIAIVQDRDAVTTGTNEMNGGSSLDIRGYVYLRNQHLQFNGGDENVDGCTFLVARSIQLTGNNDTYVETDDGICATVGIGGTSPVQNQVVLVH